MSLEAALPLGRPLRAERNQRASGPARHSGAPPSREIKAAAQIAPRTRRTTPTTAFPTTKAMMPTTSATVIAGPKNPMFLWLVLRIDPVLRRSWLGEQLTYYPMRRILFGSHGAHACVGQGAAIPSGERRCVPKQAVVSGDTAP